MSLLRLFGLLLALCAGASHAVSEADLLEPEKAFAMSTRAVDDRTVEINFAIAPGYYLYRERFKFEAEPGLGGAAFKLGTPDFPQGARKKDEFFGEVETYRGKLTVLLPVERLGSGGDTLKLAVTSQGCADVGVCYVPMQTKATIKLAAGGSAAPNVPSLTQGPDSVPASSTKAARLSGSASDFDIVALFESGSFWLVLASFLGFGLLLAFTPCMLPMIPILSGIIAGEGRDLNKVRALILSSAYVLGMAVTYAIAGVAAAYSGTLIAAALQNPWVLSAFALVFVWLALSMFGYHDLQLPAFLHDQAVFHPSQAARRARRFGGRHGRAVGDHRQPVRRRTPGRRAPLHQPDEGCGAWRRRAFRDGARHGRAAARGRRVRGRAAAEVGTLDGAGEAILRRAAARGRGLDRMAGGCPARCVEARAARPHVRAREFAGRAERKTALSGQARDARFLCRLVRLVQGDGVVHVHRRARKSEDERNAPVAGRCDGEYRTSTRNCSSASRCSGRRGSSSSMRAAPKSAACA